MALTVVESPHGVRATMDRLVAALTRRGIVVFARVDHGGGAHEVGLELADEELLIFGDPRVGTLLMQSDPEIGYELPLRVLVWKVARQTKIGYRLPTELAAEYAVDGQAETLMRIGRLLEELVGESAAPA
jgi:uncharacterized protein (DUF302 family)